MKQQRTQKIKRAKGKVVSNGKFARNSGTDSMTWEKNIETIHTLLTRLSNTK